MVTVNNGLVGYWRFEGSPSDPSVADSSKYGFPGALTNAQQGQASGLIGLAMRTTTAAGKMVVPHNFILAPKPRVSVSVWVNLDMGLASMWGTPVFVDKTGGTTTGYFLGCLTPASADVSFRVFNGAGTPYTATYTETDTSGWHHYVGVYEGSLVRLYRNGVSVATAAADGTFTESMADVDNIGAGFQGLIDELTIWNRMLTSGEVTELYNSGAGEVIAPPDLSSFATPGTVPFGYVAPTLYFKDLPIDTLPDPIRPDAIPFSASLSSSKQFMMAMLASPYVIVDSPKQIFIDPHPVIVSVSADTNHVITATANAGPTDALPVSTWWEIEIEPGVVVIVADLTTNLNFVTNHNQTDTWDVPTGQDWEGLKLTFHMQAVADAAQQWQSPPVTLTGPNYNNGSNQPPPTPQPLPPGPPLGPTQGPTVGGRGPGIFRQRERDMSRR